MIKFPPVPTGERPTWNGDRFVVGERVVRVLTYSSNVKGWDEGLTSLHEDEAGDGQHPIDVTSRKAAVEALHRFGFPRNGTLLEIGCSTGFLLHDLKRELPDAQLIGADIDLQALERLGKSLPRVPLIQLDLLQCSIEQHQFDAIVALNVLEHIEDDCAAITEMAKLLKPGGVLIVEVPQGPSLFDYYDAHLRHFRRYSRKELVAKLTNAGLLVETSGFIGALPYIPFWLVKKLNRLRFGSRGERTASGIEGLVRNQIRRTGRSRALSLLLSVENRVSGMIKFPRGIRCTAVARTPS